MHAQVSYGDAKFVGYGLCFCALVLLTIFFVITYLKRVIYMAFLTIIAPLVALTYPIDKLNDGQAQGFNKWLKEYIFNLLIQPLHLLLYTILISSADELAAKNVIYSLVAVGFLIPAEKLMRSLFGFEKAVTPPSMAGVAVGAGLVNKGIQALVSGKGKGKSGGGKNGSEESIEKPTRMGYKGSDTVNTMDQIAGNSTSELAERSEDNNIDFNNNNEYGIDEGSNSQSIDTNSNTGNYSLLDGNGKFKKVLRNGVVGTVGPAIARSRAVKKITRPVGNLKDMGINKVGNAADRIAESKFGQTVGRAGSKLGDAGRYIANSNEGKAIAGAAKGLGRVARYTAKKGIKKLPDIASRAITGAAVGTIAGTAGLVATMASGDAGNILPWAGGAAVAGATIGASRGGIDTDKPKSATQIAREKAYYGERYDEHVAQENMKKWKRNSENKEMLNMGLDKEEVKKMYDNGTIDKYLKNEITNPKDIIALEKYRKAKGGTQENAIAMHNLKNKMGENPAEMKSKDRAEWKKTFSEDLKKRHVSEEKATKKSEEVLENVKFLYGLYK